MSTEDEPDFWIWDDVMGFECPGPGEPRLIDGTPPQVGMLVKLKRKGIKKRGMVIEGDIRTLPPNACWIQFENGSRGWELCEDLHLASWKAPRKPQNNPPQEILMPTQEPRPGQLVTVCPDPKMPRHWGSYPSVTDLPFVRVVGTVIYVNGTTTDVMFPSGKQEVWTHNLRPYITFPIGVTKPTAPFIVLNLDEMDEPSEDTMDKIARLKGLDIPFHYTNNEGIRRLLAGGGSDAKEPTNESTQPGHAAPIVPCARGLLNKPLPVGRDCTTPLRVPRVRKPIRPTRKMSHLPELRLVKVFGVVPFPRAYACPYCVKSPAHLCDYCREE